MRTSATIFLASVTFLQASAHARSEECRATSDTEIASLFTRWNESLATGSPARVTANYARDSILLPTASNQPRLSAADKLDYFASFLTRKPQARIDFRTLQTGCNTALDAGVYTFTFGDGTTLRARYTFTYAWDGSNWLITSHHSSVMPEKM